MLKKIKQFVIETILFTIGLLAVFSVLHAVTLTFQAPLSPLLIFTDIFIILIMIPKRFYCNLLGRKEAYNPWDSLYMFIVALILILLNAILRIQYQEYLIGNLLDYYKMVLVVFPIIFFIIR